MRFYRGRGISDKDLPGSIGWPQQGMGADGWIALTTDEKPRKGREVGIGQRKDAARVARFWRRFHRSSLKQGLKTQVESPEKAHEALKAFLSGMPERFPSDREMAVGWRMLKESMRGGRDLPGKNTIALIGMVAQYLEKIPRTFLDLLGSPTGAPKDLEESDDEIYDLEVEQAGPMEVMIRERMLPRMLRVEMRSRRALTKWKWMRAKETEADKEGRDPTVQFLVDSSGSMQGKPFALAIAAALKLQETCGRNTSMRFVADRMGPELSLGEAINFAMTKERTQLGGGDDFGDALAKAQVQSPRVRDFVVVSDFQISSYGTTEDGKRMHVVGIGPDESNNWWQEAYSRHDFSSLI